MKPVTFYRCVLCGRMVSPWDIFRDDGKHGCRKCNGVRVTPTNLSFFEKIRAICEKPKVWTWGSYK